MLLNAAFAKFFMIFNFFRSQRRFTQQCKQRSWLNEVPLRTNKFCIVINLANLSVINDPSIFQIFSQKYVKSVFLIHKQILTQSPLQYFIVCIKRSRRRFTQQCKQRSWLNEVPLRTNKFCIVINLANLGVINDPSIFQIFSQKIC